MSTTAQTLAEDVIDLISDPDSGCYTLGVLTEHSDYIKILLNDAVAGRIMLKLNNPLVTADNLHTLIIDKDYEYADSSE